MSYALVGFGAAASSCRVDPSGWLSPANIAAVIQQVMQSAAQPYWNLPVPAPYETPILNWLLNYGYVDASKANACRLAMAGDVSVYDGKAWQGWFSTACQTVGATAACQNVAADAARYSVPFATWLKNAAAAGSGVVLASRPTLGAQWNVQQAEFIAPQIDALPPMVLAALPPQLQAGARAYAAAMAAILAAKQGQFGAARDYFLIYAPAIANLGLPLAGFGQTNEIVLPPLPPFQITYPDGQGGQVTIGTTTAPDPANPPPGAPPVTKPEEAGLPSQKLFMWTQVVGGAVGIVVAGVTLYLMLHEKHVPIPGER